MAFVVPVATDIRASYPEFTGTPDGVIDDALAEAGLSVDQTWPESAFNLAYKLYTAHLLVSAGQGSSAQAQAIAGSPAGLKMRKAGDTVEEFFQPQGQGGGSSINLDAWLSSTGYGQRFALMRRRFFGGPFVLVAPQAPRCNPYGWPFGG